MKFLFYTGALLLPLFSIFSGTFSAQTVFTNPTAVAVNDATASGAGVADPYPSTITVSGLPGTISRNPGGVKVRLNNLSHPSSYDFSMVLVAPNGAAFLIQENAGDDALKDVTYTLSDDAAAPLPAQGAWESGAYKPTAYSQSDFPAPGPGSAYNTPAGAGDATFSSTFGGANPNGVWKLFVADFVEDDKGIIAGGWSLTITTTAPAAAAVKNAGVDMNGDGKSDYVVTRETSTPFAEATGANLSISPPARSFRERKRVRRMANAPAADSYRYWYINNNGTNSYDVIPFGTTGDYETPADYDGDGKTDIAIWREGAAGAAAFYILQSSTGTFRVEPFGQTGDDPLIAGDYDGDKIADAATFRCPATTAGQCYFFYRGSLNNPTRGVTFVPVGFGIDGDYYVNPGDFDGDGKYDFCLQREIADGRGQFVLIRSSDFKDEYINWGLVTDAIVPGDFDGDGKADFMVTRAVDERLHWFLQTRAGGGTGANAVVWGLAQDFMTPGDFDGDGKTDIAVWRPNADPTKNFYFILRSSSQTLQQFEWGMNGDFPAQSWNVH